MENKITFIYEFLPTQEEVRKYIQDCEGRHSQTVSYSTFHDAITQVCFGCKKVRSNLARDIEGGSVTDDMEIKEIDCYTITFIGERYEQLKRLSENKKSMMYVINKAIDLLEQAKECIIPTQYDLQRICKRGREVEEKSN